MAVLNITELESLAIVPGGVAQIAGGDPLAFQNLTIGTEVKSAAFHARTKIIRLKAGADCAVTWGLTSSVPVATTSKMIMSAGGEYHIGVSPLHQVSVITL